MIKNIIFDLGGVLLLQNPIRGEVYLSNIFNVSLDEVKMFYENKRRDYVTGKISSVELLSEFKKISRSPIPVNRLLDEFKNEYIKDIIRINYELIELVDSLKKDFRVYIFSNTVDIHDRVVQKTAVYSHFERVFKSYTDHIFKPEPESYKYVINKIAAKPEECVFIDDLKTNVEGAQAVGMQGIRYENNHKLIEDLNKIGVAI